MSTMQTPMIDPPRWQPKPPLRAGPEMAATGKGVFTPILDGAWLVGDFEQDQFLDGKVVITWKAH
jgi:hypothetical protein